MKNVILGLLLGIGFSALVGYLRYPEMKKATYDLAFNEGKKVGATETKEAALQEGIAQGIAQTETKNKVEIDSLTAVMTLKRAASERAARPAVKKEKIIQNFHVIGGEIGEPIIDTAN